MELFLSGSKQWLQILQEWLRKNAFPRAWRCWAGLHWSLVSSSRPHLPGDLLFSMVKKHVSCFCSIRTGFCLQGRWVWASLAIGSELCSWARPRPLLICPLPLYPPPHPPTVWSSTCICCSVCPCYPQPCWKGTGASLALHPVCTDILDDYANLRSHGRRAS